MLCREKGVHPHSFGYRKPLTGYPNAAKLFLEWAMSREGQALMIELGSFSAMNDAPVPEGVDPKSIKTWYPDDDEIAKIFAAWTDDWNKAYNYRQ